MSIEAMKQALEALEHLQPTALTSFYTIGNRDKAITSIRQAIEQAEKQEHHAKDCALLQIPSRDCDCSQNQEPVALDSIRLVVLETDHPADKMPIESQRLFAAGWNAAIDALKKRGPLYPAPQPRREWVGLGEARGIVQAFLEKPTPARYSDAFMEGACWAEAKLKELNHVN